MFRLRRQHLEVVVAVVLLIAVAVVYHFAWKQLPAEFDFGQNAVDVTPVEFHISIWRALPALLRAALHRSSLGNLGVLLSAPLLKFGRIESPDQVLALLPGGTVGPSNPDRCTLADKTAEALLPFLTHGREYRAAPLAGTWLSVR
jgi:hypothetical protein